MESIKIEKDGSVSKITVEMTEGLFEEFCNSEKAKTSTTTEPRKKSRLAPPYRILVKAIINLTDGKMSKLKRRGVKRCTKKRRLKKYKRN